MNRVDSDFQDMLSQSNLNLFPQALYVYNVSNGGLTKVKDRCVWTDMNRNQNLLDV